MWLFFSDDLIKITFINPLDSLGNSAFTCHSDDFPLHFVAPHHVCVYILFEKVMQIKQWLAFCGFVVL